MRSMLIDQNSSMLFQIVRTREEDLSCLYEMTTSTLGIEHYPNRRVFQDFACHIIQTRNGYIQHVMHNENLIGYFYLIPLKTNIYNDLCSGRKGELEIQTDDVETSPYEKVIYIADLVISHKMEGYRRAQASSFLVHELANQFSPRSNRIVCALPLTKSGMNIATRRLGLRQMPEYPSCAGSEKTPHPRLWGADEASVCQTTRKWHSRSD